MAGGSDTELPGRPIGVRLAAWRACRGLGVAELADHCGLSLDRLVDLESGRDWVDRHGLLTRAAGILRVDPGDLTGQPYLPADKSQATVTGFAYRARRGLGQATGDPVGMSSASVDELAVRMAQASEAAASGDELALATALPELIAGGEAVVAGSLPAERDRTRRLLRQALLLGAGLLRRLGYRDLAWILVHRAEREAGPGMGIAVEQVRLLLACGHPEEALTCATQATHAATRDRPHDDDAEHDLDAEAELAALAALAHAVAGRPGNAARALDAAEHRARSGTARATLAAARTVTAVESGAVDEVPHLLDAIDLAALPPASRADLLVVAAGAAARRGGVGDAAAQLVEADRLAPLRVRRDPFARDLLAVLPARTDEPDAIRALRTLAEGAGLPLPGQRPVR
jgi:transcriptional regulator with XRE-family HTH domain